MTKVMNMPDKARVGGEGEREGRLVWTGKEEQADKGELETKRRGEDFITNDH